ncbi:hypothetical protein [Streptomyces sp. NPDC002671]
MDAKITGGERVEPAQAAPALDLIAALEASVRAAERMHQSSRPRP